MAGHRWQVQQHGEAGGAFDQGADRGAVQADDEVPCPVSRNSPILDLSGPLTDQDFLGDERSSPAAGTGSGHPQGPPGTQSGRQLAPQPAASLDVEGLVDRLM